MTTTQIRTGSKVEHRGDYSNDGGIYTVTRVADGWFWYSNGTAERCAPLALLTSPRWRIVSV